MKPPPLAILALLTLTACAAPQGPGGAPTGAIKLTPANPQPDPKNLKPGLAVRYAYPADVKTLIDAQGWGASAEPGPALDGFDYPDQGPGARALTSEKTDRVVAVIDGYVRFDAPGVQKLQFWSNDGLRVTIGGAQVYEHDKRHRCVSLGPVSVDAPEAGWYPVSALFFQRLNTSCLRMEAQSAALPRDRYAHIPR